MSQKSMAKKSCLLNLCQNDGVASAWLNSVGTGSVCWCPLAYVSIWFIFGNVRGHIGVSSGVFRDVLDPQACAGVYLRAQGCSGMYLRAEFMQDSVWLEPTHQFGTSWKAKFVFTWLLWDIKISKPPYVTSLKMVELCHFWSFSDLSERNYNSQSFWITLYLSFFASLNKDELSLQM